MKRLILIVAALCLMATPSHAITRWSYNPSSFSPIRTLGQWAIGNQRIAVQSIESWVQVGPCWQKVFTVYSVWYNHFTHETTVVVDGSVVKETSCP